MGAIKQLIMSVTAFNYRFTFLYSFLQFLDLELLMKPVLQHCGRTFSAEASIQTFLKPKDQP